MMRQITKPPKPKQSGDIFMGRWLFFIVLIAVGLYGWWFYANHERINISEYRPKSDSHNNPFFAAEVLLHHHGKSAQFLNGGAAGERLAEIWQQDATEAGRTVVVLSDDHVPLAEDMDAMVAWMRNGGHLIVQGCTYGRTFYTDEEEAVVDANALTADAMAKMQQAARTEGHFLDYLGVVCADLPMAQEISAPFADALDTRFIVLRLEDKLALVSTGYGRLDDSRLHVFFKDEVSRYQDYRAVWQHMKKSDAPLVAGSLAEDEWLALRLFVNANPQYYQPEQMLIDVNFGQGRLTVINGSGAFDNPYSVSLENLWLADVNAARQVTATTKPEASPLWRRLTNADTKNDDKSSYRSGLASADHGYLLRYLVAERADVWLIGHSEHPNLVRLMWKNTRFMMLAMMVTVLMALLTLPRQFGRRLTYRSDQGQNYLHYFALLGDYLWATDQSLRQVADNRSRLMERLKARLPLLTHTTTPEAICQLIAEDADLSVEMVYLALYGIWRTDGEFIAMTDAFAVLARHYDGH